jgi:hypothetical protein
MNPEYQFRQITYALRLFNATISSGFGVSSMDAGTGLTTENGLNKVKPESCPALRDEASNFRILRGSS